MLRSLNIAIAVLLVIGLNLLSYQFFVRFDFTEGDVYTLSDASESIAQNLEENIQVKVFLSSKLPPQVAKIKQDLEDYLDEYAALSDGKLNISYSDPLVDEEAKSLAQFLGIPPLQLNVIEKDQQQTVKVYMGLALVNENEALEEDEGNSFMKYEKNEVIPVLTDLSNFEYDFTSALKKVSTTEEKVVGFLQGHGEHELVSAYNRNPFFDRQKSGRQDYNFREILEKNYTIKTITLEEEEAKIEEVDTLIIAGPQEAFSEGENDAIKSFVKAGGNVLFFIDRLSINPGMLPATKMPEAFEDLLDHWGISVFPALVKDASHTQAAFSRGFFSFSLPYPFWVKVRNMNKENAITAQLESFFLPWISPLEIEDQEDTNIDILALTSERYELALTDIEVEVPTEDDNKNEDGSEVEGEQEIKKEIQERPINLDPNQKFGISRTKKAPLPLAVLAQKEGEEGKIFVIGDSDFINEDFSSRFPENMIFFLNTVDALTLGDELISIRSKGITDRPISELSESQKNLIRWGNILVVPILVVVFGYIYIYTLP